MIFGFVARPKVHMYVKPTVLRAAAERYGFDLRLPVDVVLGDVFECPRFRADGSPRRRRSASPRHDRRPVVPLGGGVRRVRLTPHVERRFEDNPCRRG
jgi:hypothetical protein